MKKFLLDPSQAAGDKYSPVVISPQSIARRASSAQTLRAVSDLCAELRNDPYTNYVAEFYRRGLAAAGDDWFFMDIVSVLFAVSSMGQPENYLEIGVRRGRSACAVAKASPGVDIFAFDMWQQNYASNENPGPELVRAELARFGHRGAITFVEGDSHKTIPMFMAENPDLTFDLITVDGDHSIEGAIDDLNNVAPRLRVGGVLVFDDTGNPYCHGLTEVWKDFLTRHKDFSGYTFGELGTGLSFAIRLGTPRRDAQAHARRSPLFGNSWK